VGGGMNGMLPALMIFNMELFNTTTRIHYTHILYHKFTWLLLTGVNYGERVLFDRIPNCTFFETSTHNCIFFVLLLYLLLKTTQSS
jgi:hypothetical protein